MAYQRKTEQKHTRLARLCQEDQDTSQFSLWLASLWLENVLRRHYKRLNAAENPFVVCS